MHFLQISQAWSGAQKRPALHWHSVFCVWVHLATVCWSETAAQTKESRSNRFKVFRTQNPWIGLLNLSRITWAALGALQTLWQSIVVFGIGVKVTVLTRASLVGACTGRFDIGTCRKYPTLVLLKQTKHLFLLIK